LTLLVRWIGATDKFNDKFLSASAALADFSPRHTTNRYRGCRQSIQPLAFGSILRALLSRMALDSWFISNLHLQTSLAVEVWNVLVRFFLPHALFPHRNFRPRQETELAGHLLSTLAVAFIPMHFLMMFCAFHILYFVSKSLLIVETGSPVSFYDYAGAFFLIGFFPVGVWTIQPRINRLYRAASKSTKGDPSDSEPETSIAQV
jgi:hypothetical protein